MRTCTLEERGMGRLSIIMIVGLLLLGGVGVVAMVSQNAATSSGQSTSPPDSAEMEAVASALETWIDAQYPVLPADSTRAASGARIVVKYKSFRKLPRSWRTSQRAEYARAVSQILSPRYAKTSGNEDSDPVGFIQEQMSNRAVKSDGLPVAWEHRILGVEYRCTLASGDVVVWLRYWTGEQRAFDISPSGVAQPQRMRYVDNAPTDEYVLRNTASGWRIVDMAPVDFGPDASDAYGPNTAHGHEYTYSPQDVQGWAPGPTPAPGATAMPTASPSSTADPAQ